LAYFVDEPCGLVDSLRCLGRMARVLVAPLRTRIMIAASVRPMSSTMFQEEHGGGAISRINDNFKELARYGWLVPVETRTGGRRRGGIERLYRAVQVPAFDSNTWPALPRAMRELYSWGAYTTLVEEAEGALVAGTMEARSDRRLTCLPCFADRLAWDRILERADGLFGFILEELTRADSRLAISTERPIPATAALAVFESPAEPFTPDYSREQIQIGVARVSMYPYLVRMAKAMIDPLRILILAELSSRAMSAKQFYEEFGGGDVTEGKVYRAFRVLRDYDWLVAVDAKVGDKRRGGKERFYRAARPATFDDVAWPSLPPSLQNTGSGAVIESLTTRVRQAIEAGTMDVRTDRHLTWMPLVFDRLGWGRIIEQLEALLEFVRNELKAADARLARTGEEPIPMTVALVAFKSPLASTRMH
jgi:hypothetical protein